jgi:uncharacterized protein YqfA (UPF0365 family)
MPVQVAFGLIILFFIGYGVLTFFIPIPLWVASMLSNSTVGIFTMIGMRFRGIDPAKIVLPYIRARKAGIMGITVNDLQAHYLSKGNIEKVIYALIAAQKADINLDFNKAAGIDLAGRDVFEAVKTSINPKVIKTKLIGNMAKDGIQVFVLCRVTVKANIDKLIGGADEKTILARVGEGIVTAIGAAESHKDILENPDHISKKILEKGLDNNTAYTILSIDIADVDVGKNVGAQNLAAQAEADKNIAQAKAEEKKSFALAREQEMIALQHEMKAKVVEAEAKVPEAISVALKTKKLSIMDYYKLKNIQADTLMRDSISKK